MPCGPLPEGVVMKAWCLPKFGTIESLSLEAVPEVPPASDEVMLDVLCAALNPADRYLAEGLYPARPTFPHVLGRDGLGVVVRAGAGVAGWKPGDKALLLRGEAGVTRPGTLAERVTVPADCLEPVPAGWTDEEAACAALVYVTAHQALTQWGELPPGVVLVSGGSGGVGLATVQLAAALGHTVVALSRGTEKSRRIGDAGAALVLDPADPEWRARLKEFIAPRRVDLAVDTIGGELLPRMIDTLAMGGRVSLVGMLAGPVPQLNTASLFFRRIRLGGVAVGTYSREESRAAWREVVAILDRSGKRPIIDSVFPLEEVPAAFARLAAGPLGKVLVRVRDVPTAPAGTRGEPHGGSAR
jgi:NADPH2:quinone reductase